MLYVVDCIVWVNLMYMVYIFVFNFVCEVVWVDYWLMVYFDCVIMWFELMLLLLC